MSPHLSLIYQFLVVATGIAAFAVVGTRSRKTGRRDHRWFTAFWGSFTLWLLSRLVRDYLLTNFDGLEPVTGLLLYAVDINLSFITVALILIYFHHLLGGKGRLVDALIALVLFISILSISPPWGVGIVQGDVPMIEFRTGMRIGTSLYLLNLGCAVILSWISFRRRAGGERRRFLGAIAVFASLGFTETFVSFIGDLGETHVLMEAGSVVYSTLPYMAYSVFLIVYLGRELTGTVNRNSPVDDSSYHRKDAPDPDPFAGYPELTPREQEVILLVVQGMSNNRIAGELYVSLATVKSHLYNIYRKTDVSSRFALMQLFNTHHIDEASKT